MAQTNPWILVDNRQAPWSSIGPGWIENSALSFLDGTCAWARYNDTTWLSVNFTGIRISYYGNAIGLIPWNYTSSIDGSAPEYHAMTEQEGYKYLTYAWYTSPEVSAGNHTLALTEISQGIAIDYLLVQPSRTQNLNGTRLAVDDEDPLVIFTGNWSVVDDRYPNDGVWEPDHYFVPHGGKTHVSNHVGDVLQFPFTGNSVQVYGFFDWSSFGKVSLSFTFDNEDWTAQELTYPREGVDGGTFIVQPNFLYFQTSVPAGDHILTMNVTNVVGNQRVIIDVIYYTASFDTLETMPQITVPSLTTKPSSLPSPNPAESTSPNGNHVGAIAGGAVGGSVGVLLVLVVAWLIIRRKRDRSKEESSIGSDNYPPGMIIEPFTLPGASNFAGPTQLSWSNGAVKVAPLRGKSRSSPSYPHVASSSFNATTRAGPVRDPRNPVEELERQVQELARRTEELQDAQNRNALAPPAYQEVSS